MQPREILTLVSSVEGKKTVLCKTVSFGWITIDCFNVFNWLLIAAFVLNPNIQVPPRL